MTPRKLLLALGASGILLIGTVGTSLAGNVTTTGGVRSGPLTLTTTPTVSLSTTLDGSDLLVSGSLGASTVVDATGSGAGWRLTIAGTTFKSAAGKTLPADALTITGVTVVKNSGKSPTNTTSYPVTVPMAATAPAAREVRGRGGGLGDGQVHGHAGDRAGGAGRRLRRGLREHADDQHRLRPVAITVASCPRSERS